MFVIFHKCKHLELITQIKSQTITSNQPKSGNYNGDISGCEQAYHRGYTKLHLLFGISKAIITNYATTDAPLLQKLL